jgi:DNA-binding transcriptional LysR family regulator
MVIIGPPGHPLLQVGHAPAASLAPYPFIVREQGSGTRAAMQQFMNEHRLQPAIAMEISSNETIKQAVMAGMGLSFLSLHTVGLEVRSGLLKVLDIDGTPLMRTWNVVHLQSRTLSPVSEAFRYFLIEHGEQHLLAHDAPLLRPAV